VDGFIDDARLSHLDGTAKNWQGTSGGGGWKKTDLLKRAFSGYCKTKSWPRFELEAFMNLWWGTGKWAAWESGWSEAAGDGGRKLGNIGIWFFNNSEETAQTRKSTREGLRTGKKMFQNILPQPSPHGGQERPPEFAVAFETSLSGQRGWAFGTQVVGLSGFTA
jgi:hypothetical protein